MRFMLQAWRKEEIKAEDSKSKEGWVVKMKSDLLSPNLVQSGVQPPNFFWKNDFTFVP